MFIKVPHVRIDDDQYINTDHIAAIVPVTGMPTAAVRPLDAINSDYVISLSNGFFLTVSSAIAAHVAALMDVDDSFVDTETTDAPPVMSLGGQIANFIRNHPNGLTENQIMGQTEFLAWDPATIRAALDALVTENVLTMDIAPLEHPASGQYIWRHNTTPGATTASW